MFKIERAQPTSGEATCQRCGMKIYRATSKKNLDRTVTVDSRPGPYVLEEQSDGTILAAWRGPSAGYAYHYNSTTFACADDSEVKEANDV
jgi:hypothetical protein